MSENIFRRAAQMIDPLSRLQNWYLAHCDGDWEHSFGVSISTLDNPGWALKINLVGTSCSGRALPETSVGDSDVDAAWYVCWVDNNEFHAAGSALMLTTMIGYFLDWASAE